MFSILSNSLISVQKVFFALASETTETLEFLFVKLLIGSDPPSEIKQYFSSFLISSL